MDNVFTVCMIIGFVVPLITLIFGTLLDGLFEGIEWLDSITSFDIDFGFDIGDFEICFLPFSIHSICAGLLIFGATGKLLSEGSLSDKVLLIITITAGYIAAVLVQSLIKRLKKVENTTYSEEQLIGFTAKVVNTIVKGGYGSISISTADGITTTYPAKAKDPESVIKQDTIVTVVEFQKNIAIVMERNL